MAEKKEKKNRLLALLYTLGLHAALLVLMFFIAAWRLPNPPLPESGMLINLGFDEQGSGDVQPDEPVGSEKHAEQKTEESKPEEAVKEDVQETVKPVEEKPAEEELLASKEESPVVVKEKKEDKKLEEKPKEEPKKIEPKKEEPKKEEPRKVDPNAAYKAPNSESVNTSEGGSREGKPGNQGDKDGKVGDMGNPNGTPEAKALYGKPGGGGGGPSLDLSGWQWDERPVPNVPNNESGRIVFEIKVDENGDIISIKTLERSISLEAEQSCKKSIERLTFSKTGSNVPEVSTGRITFVVRAR